MDYEQSKKVLELINYDEGMAVVCLATLLACGELKMGSGLDEAEDYFERVLGGDCEKCPCWKRCLLVELNE